MGHVGGRRRRVHGLGGLAEDGNVPSSLGAGHRPTTGTSFLGSSSSAGSSSLDDVLGRGGVLTDDGRAGRRGRLDLVRIRWSGIGTPIGH